MTVPPVHPEDWAATLGIDTATSFLSLALVDAEGSTLAEADTEVWRDHAVRIVPELEALFAAAGIGHDAIGAVCVGTGPGSYTGLRIGLATAAGLAYGWNVPVVGSDTLAALAAGGLAPGETGIAAIDARRGNVYFGVYRLGATGPTTLAAPTKASRETVSASYPGLRIVEGIAPSAVWHARAARELKPATAVYL